MYRHTKIVPAGNTGGDDSYIYGPLLRQAPAFSSVLRHHQYGAGAERRFHYYAARPGTTGIRTVAFAVPQ